MTDFAIGSKFRLRRPNILSRVLQMLWIWHKRRVGRAELAGLSDEMLHDIGLSRSLIASEVEKPFWRG